MTDPTRAALEALVELVELEEADDPHHIYCDEDSAGNHGFDGDRYRIDLHAAIAAARAALATPPATEERCGFVVESSVGPYRCGWLAGERIHTWPDHHAYHPFTPPAPEPSAALVEEWRDVIVEAVRDAAKNGSVPSRQWLHSEIDNLLAAARAEGLDVEAVADRFLADPMFAWNVDGAVRRKQREMADALAARARRTGEGER